MIKLLISIIGFSPAHGGTIAADNFVAYQTMQCVDPGDASHRVTLQAPSLSANWTLTLPTNDGDSGQFLQTNGSGVTTWATEAAGITQLTGDVTAGPGSGSQAATLATVNSNVGSFTNASITVNGKGLVTAASSGTTPVTSLTVASANGFAGSFSASTTPVLTLTTTVTGNVCGNGTALSACSTTGTGATVLASSPTITTPTIAKLANLTTNGYVKTSGGDGTLSVQTIAIPVTDGGTGQTSYTDGQLLIGNSSGNTLTKATLTAGDSISITNGNGSITVASTDSTNTDDYTPTLSGFGTISTQSVQWWRHKDRVYVKGYFGPGTMQTANGTFTLPNSYTIDGSKLGKAAATNEDCVPIGLAQQNVANVQVYLVACTTTSTSLVYIARTFNVASNLVPAAADSQFQNNSAIFFEFEFPITDQ